MNVGTTTTAATNHGFLAAFDLGGESAATVTCLRRAGSWANRWFVTEGPCLAKTSRHPVQWAAY
jgi:hypothetical protein